MNLALQSFVLGSLLSITSVLASAQGLPCDGTAAHGAVIGCVTGTGVEIKGPGNPGSDSPGPVGIALPPDQRPAIPPLVTYANGKLTIIAKNAMLSDILEAVGEKTGAVIDVPEGATERVVSELGPGPARDVIAALLNGSHFNYVMVGTETNPNSVARVILTAKSESKDAAASQNTVARAGFPMRPGMQQAQFRPYQAVQPQPQAQPAPPPDPQPVAVEQPVMPAPPDQAAANSAPAATGSGVAEAAAAAEPAQPVSPATASANGSGDKSPQQVLQDLYETRRQMIEAQRQPPQPQ